MTRSIEIRIPGRPPTPNARRHWRVVANDNKAWAAAARKAATDAIGPDFGPPIRRARVEIEFVVPDRRKHDWDNLIASTVALTNGIKGLVIADDDSDVIASVTFPAIRMERGQSATVYRITELPNDQLLLMSAYPVAEISRPPHPPGDADSFVRVMSGSGTKNPGNPT